ncbi:MAG: hypothetical protein ACLRPU_00465, partial [Enterococcus hulanensis]
VVYDGIDTNGGAKNPDDGGDQAKNLNDTLKAGGTTETIYPNESLAEKKAKLAAIGFKIEWEWPFERPETGSLEAVNEWDTVVGNRAADPTTLDADMPRFAMSMSYKAVQVD